MSSEISPWWPSSLLNSSKFWDAVHMRVVMILFASDDFYSHHVLAPEFLAMASVSLAMEAAEDAVLAVLAAVAAVLAAVAAVLAAVAAVFVAIRNVFAAVAKFATKLPTKSTFATF